MTTMIEEIAAVRCCVCGVCFGLSSYCLAKRREDKKQFYCPNGHSQSFLESDAERLTRDLANVARRCGDAEETARRCRDRAEQAERREARLKRRLKSVPCKP